MGGSCRWEGKKTNQKKNKDKLIQFPYLTFPSSIHPLRGRKNFQDFHWNDGLFFEEPNLRSLNLTGFWTFNSDGTRGPGKIPSFSGKFRSSGKWYMYARLVEFIRTYRVLPRPQVYCTRVYTLAKTYQNLSILAICIITMSFMTISFR